MLVKGKAEGSQIMYYTPARNSQKAGGTSIPRPCTKRKCISTSHWHFRAAGGHFKAVLDSQEDVAGASGDSRQLATWVVMYNLGEVSTGNVAYKFISHRRIQQTQAQDWPSQTQSRGRYEARGPGLNPNPFLTSIAPP